MRAVGLGIAAMSLSACATFTHGSTEDLFVVSDPAGATATLSTGLTCTTPCKFSINRTDDYTVTFVKSGYAVTTVPVKSESTDPDKSDPRIITYDYLGRALDSQNGAYSVHIPNPVSVTLKNPPA